MTRPTGSESEFRRLWEQALRAAGRGPGPAQRPPAGQGAPGAAKPAGPQPAATQGPASTKGPDRRQPARPVDQSQAPTTGDNDRLDEL